MHFFYSNFYRIGILKFNNATASWLVIFISEKFNVSDFPNLCSEQILQILPAKIIGNVWYVDSSIRGFPTTIVPFSATITTRRIYTILSLGSPVTVALSTSVPFVIILHLTPKYSTRLRRNKRAYGESCFVIACYRTDRFYHTLRNL